VTVELACRLLENKVLLRTEVAAALLDASARGIALVQSLVERIPGAIAILETEFSRWSGPFQTSLNVDEQLIQTLPLGMCERLLALPLQRRELSSVTSLAVVDPFDRHVLSEFEFCLSTAVTPVRVAYPVLVQALDTVRQTSSGNVDVLLDVPDDETPAFGTRMLRVSRRPKRDKTGRPGGPVEPATPVLRRGFTVPSVEAPESSSEPPFPLVRTTMAPGRGNVADASDNTPPPGSIQRDSEPVLRLVKQKPSMTIRRVSIPPPPRFAEQGGARPEDVLETLDHADSPRRLIELLREALRPLAPCQAYFSLRSGRYALEWASGTERTDRTVLTPEQEAILGTACQAGYFLGPLPPDGTLRALGATLGLRAREEVYVAPVSIAHRPALVVVVGRFDEAFAVTRWVDSVVSRAGQVLERLARTRKHT
jgi:hypothetical protein